MVGVAQSAEHRVVAPAVEGSNPFTHPTSPSKPLENVQFYSRSRTIPQDSGIGQLSDCPRGEGHGCPESTRRYSADAWLRATTGILLSTLRIALRFTSCKI